MQIRVKQAIDEAVPPPYEEKERILVGTAQCTGIAGAPTLLAPIRTDLQRERQWLKEEQQRLEGAQTELNEQQCNLDQGIRKFEQRQGSEKRPLTEEVHHALEKGRQDLENRRKAVKNREKEVMNRRQARENRRQALQRAERDAIAAALGKFRDSQVDDWKNQNTVAALLFSGALGFLSGSTVGHNTRALMLLGSVVALFSVMTGTAIVSRFSTEQESALAKTVNFGTTGLWERWKLGRTQEARSAKSEYITVEELKEKHEDLSALHFMLCFNTFCLIWSGFLFFVGLLLFVIYDIMRTKLMLGWFTAVLGFLSFLYVSLFLPAIL